MPVASVATGLCGAATAFTTALNGLKTLDISTAGVTGLSSALAALKTAGTQLKAVATAAVGTTVDAFQGAVAGLQTTLSGITSPGAFVAAIASIRTSVAGIVTSGTAVVDSVKAGNRLPLTGCPLTHRARHPTLSHGPCRGP